MQTNQKLLISSIHSRAKAYGLMTEKKDTLRLLQESFHLLTNQQSHAPHK